MTNEIMTIEEAINALIGLKDYYNDENEDSYIGFDDADNKALDMAVRALEVVQFMEKVFLQELPGLDMRDATEEERSSLKHYIDSISQSTGVKFDEEIENCRDCIDRNELLRYMENTEISQFLDEINNGNDNYSSCVLYEYVQEMPSITPQQRWIPINDETDLPQDKHMWVTHRNASGYCYVDELSWDMTEWSDCTDDVVAYMEYNMPEPYEEE